MSAWDQGVTSDSPTGTAVDGASSAGTQNTETVAPPPVQPSIPYERFKEVNDGYRSEAAARAAAESRATLLEQQGQQYQQRLAALEQQLTRRANTPSRSPEEEQGRQTALRALRELQQDDPDYARTQQLLKAAPALAQSVIQMRQELQQMRSASMQSFIANESGRLKALATDAGLAHSPGLENYVAGIIRADPQVTQMFLNGDPRVLPAAVQIAKQQIAAATQASRAQVATTKDQLQRLPPRIGGGTPGSTPPPQYDPKDPRGSMARIHAAAEAALLSAG